MNMDKIANCLSMTKEQAKDVFELFNRLVNENHKLSKGIQLQTEDDYIGWWENNWYRSISFGELVKSEVEQGGWEGLEDTWEQQAENFCTSELNNTIFLLPCGMYAQYV